MVLNGGKIVLEALKEMGTKDIFGYPGGAVIPLYDELFDQKDYFNHYRGAHEQGAVHAADGYARTTDEVGVCFVTSGPGATNTITGIATAYMDSVPLLVISGQVPTGIIGKDSFQEIDITGVTMSITKHNYLVDDIEDLERTVKEAYLIASSGRPGPVLIDIPKDIFINSCEYKHLNVKIKNDLVTNTNNLAKIKESVELIKSAKKPVIYAGGGVKLSKAEDLLFQLADSYNIPVVNTLMGLGCFPREHELSLGLVGMHGFSEANLAVMSSDLIIAVGARFSDRVIGDPEKFAKNAKVIHIDIDKTELDKNIFSEVKLAGDAKEILKEIISQLDDKLKHDDWLVEVNALKQKSVFSPMDFHPGNILKMVQNKLPMDTIVATDVGQHQMWTAQFWNFNHSDTFITSGGLGTMGYGLGAALGAKAGNKDRAVLLVTGDGSFRMNCNELSLIKKYNLPILVLLFNNNTLGMVRQWQKMFQNKRYAETDIEDIDYIMLANAYGIPGEKVESLDDLNQVLADYDFNEPLFVECKINIDENVLPIVPPGKAISNLILN
ncbi:MAG TPA: biosynthetic-type acetolactate synthase large subunit [Clostridia bacterium]|nr:biosynthetic-type acetolactate synthase large subunit [Clostridia bacterium]